MSLTQDQISGIIRAILAMVAGFFAAKFGFDVAKLDSLVTAVTLFCTTAAWSWLTKSHVPYTDTPK